MANYLDKTGLTTLWSNIKSKFLLSSTRHVTQGDKIVTITQADTSTDVYAPAYDTMLAASKATGDDPIVTLTKNDLPVSNIKIKAGNTNTRIHVDDDGDIVVTALQSLHACVCDSAGTDPVKVVTSTTFTAAHLFNGVIINVHFNNTGCCSYNSIPTINVNGTGAYPITNYNGATSLTTTYCGMSNDAMYMFNGTGWTYLSSPIDSVRFYNHKMTYSGSIGAGKNAKVTVKFKLDNVYESMQLIGMRNGGQYMVASNAEGSNEIIDGVKYYTFACVVNNTDSSAHTGCFVWMHFALTTNQSATYNPTVV